VTAATTPEGYVPTIHADLQPIELVVLDAEDVGNILFIHEILKSHYCSFRKN
jgi:hypothetical protein